MNTATFQYYIKKKFTSKLLHFLRQGVTPHKLSLTVAVGVSLGLMPVFGVSTLLTFIFALLLRLNQAAAQLVNYFMYPLWFLLFVPYLSAGNILFDIPPLNIHVTQILDMFKSDFSGTMMSLGMVHLRAIIVWAITTPFIAIAAYYISYLFFKKFYLKKVKVT